MEETPIKDGFLGTSFEAVETPVAEQKPPVAHHWLCVSYVSPGAEEWIVRCGGQVRRLCENPQLIAVGLAYDPRGSWRWSKGRQEHRKGVEFWNTGEIQEGSTEITLKYGNAEDKHALAEYCSAEANYLILPDEEFDAETWQVKPEEATEIAVSSGNTTSSSNDLGDLDDHPF